MTRHLLRIVPCIVGLWTCILGLWGCGTEDGGPGAPSCADSLDLTPLALASEYCTVVRAAVDGSPSAVAYAPGELWTYSLTATGTGKTHRGEVVAWPIDMQEHKLGPSMPVLSFTAQGEKVFAGEYLALSARRQVAVGYTASGSFDGEVVYGEKTGAARVKAKATGNYDVSFLDESTLLINGTGVGPAQDGQGLYVAQEGQAPRRLIKDLGDYSGHVAVGSRALFAGGFFKDTNKVYAFSLDEVHSAISSGRVLSAAADGDLVYTGGVSDVAALADDLLVARTDPSFKFEAVTLVPTTVTGATVQAGAARDIVTRAASGATAVRRMSADNLQLALLLDDGARKLELAVVRVR